jgi:NitT/TauT family transport system permease protein
VTLRHRSMSPICRATRPKLSVGAIVGEWIGSTEGVGALIIQATYNFDSALLYATVIVGSSFSVLFFVAISMAERLVVRWHAPAIG